MTKKVSIPIKSANIRKNFRIMKLIVLFLAIAISISYAGNSYSQATTLNLKMKNKTVREVFTEIEKNSEYIFLYNSNTLDPNRVVSINVEKETISKVLDKLFEGTDNIYKVSDRQVYISKASGQQTLEDDIQQQKKQISGKVTDENSEPIPGANVIEKGTTNGTVTDIDGNFTLSVEDDAILHISFIGYLAQDINTTGKIAIDIILHEDTKALEEVVVVGYGTQKKVNLTGSVSSVNISKLAETRPIITVSSGLAGLIPGLYVKSSNNVPENEASLLVRGQGTLNNASPLIIIDGAESSLDHVSPMDIASISILKDAASAAIYGSRAANGVILITTKQGEKGKLLINYNGYVSAQSVANKMDFVSSNADYMELQNEAMKNSNQTPRFTEANITEWRAHDGENSLLWPSTNWMDAAFRTALTSNHNVSVSGGTDRIKTFISMNIKDTPGIVENTGAKKVAIRSNNQLDVTSWLRLGVNLSASLTDRDPGTNNVSDFFSSTSNAVPSIVIKSPDGRFGGTNNKEESLAGCLSPLAYLYKNKGDNKARGLDSKFFVTLTPLKGLIIIGSYHYDYWDNKIVYIPQQVEGWNFQTDEVTYRSELPTKSVKDYDNRSVRNFMDANVSYENNLFKYLSFKLMVGGSQEQYTTENFSAQKYGLPDNQVLTQINGATGESVATGSLSDWAMRSFFGRVNLGWNNKYLFEFNYRRDGSSRFIGDNRWGGFPSFSAGWRLSEEPFMRSIRESWLDNLKFRASWGSLGNNSVGNYDAIALLSSSLYPLNGKPVTGYSAGNLANANLKWESTYVTNIGFDFGIKNKLSGSIEFYNKLTKDILAKLPIPLEVGLLSEPYQNSAEVRNQGLEINLDWQDKIESVNYFVNGNFTFNKNEVRKFKGGEASISGSEMIKEGYGINTQYVRLVDRIVQNETDLAVVQQIIDKAPSGKNPFPDGRPQLGDLLYKDANGDGLINDDDRMPVGHGANPRFLFGLTLGANWDRFDFSCQFDGVAGINTYFQNNYYTTSIMLPQVINKDVAEGRWYEGRTTEATFPRLTTWSVNRNVLKSDFWVKDNSFLKVRNIQLGYTMPSTIMSTANISRLRVYISLENFFTITNYPGLDPEVSGVGYPTMKQAVLGLNLSF